MGGLKDREECRTSGWGLSSRKGARGGGELVRCPEKKQSAGARGDPGQGHKIQEGSAVGKNGCMNAEHIGCYWSIRVSSILSPLLVISFLTHTPHALLGTTWPAFPFLAATISSAICIPSHPLPSYRVGHKLSTSTSPHPHQYVR